MNKILTLNGLVGSAHVGLPLAITVLLQIADIWVPQQYHDQLEKTQHVLIIYGIAAASRTSTGNTSFFVKQQDKPDQPKPNS